MLDSKLATEEDLKAIEKSVLDEVDESVKFADESPKPVRISVFQSRVLDDFD